MDWFTSTNELHERIYAPYGVVEELADPAVFGGQDRERAAVVLGDGVWAWGGNRGGARPNVMRHACPRLRGIPD
jgi:hypothetical protein